ncbi:SirB2 family protein [Aliidiomarina sp. Khilg15.8]
MFSAFKHIHTLIALLSVIFLILRFAYGMRGAANLNKKWLKIVPHVIDLLLILSIIGMLTSVGTSVFPSAFLSEKLTMFVLYIIFSVVMVLSLRGRLSKNLRIPAFVLALISWLWLIKVAFSKMPVLFG